MKYKKILGLLAVAAAALPAFAGPASATELTSPKGTKLPVGTVIKAQSAGAVSLTGSITVTCQKASGEGEITNAGGKSTTVAGFVTFGQYSECGNHTVTVLDTGKGELHSIGNNTATITAAEVEVTVLLHSFLLGTIHCIYASEPSLSFGTITGSEHGSNTAATLDLNSVPIPRKPTDGACGTEAFLEGSGHATTPEHIYID